MTAPSTENLELPKVPSFKSGEKGQIIASAALSASVDSAFLISAFLFCSSCVVFFSFFFLGASSKVPSF